MSLVVNGCVLYEVERMGHWHIKENPDLAERSCPLVISDLAQPGQEDSLVQVGQPA